MIAFTVAHKVIAVVITSSPGPTPADKQDKWSPAVPEFTAKAYLVPLNFLNSSSNKATLGPVPIQPDLKVDKTSLISSSSIRGLPKIRKFASDRFDLLSSSRDFC